MEYTFTDNQLNAIHQWMELTPFVSEPYRWYMGLKENAVVATNDVEDFAIAFYTAYNAKYPNTY